MNDSQTSDKNEDDTAEARACAALVVELQWFAPRLTGNPATDFALRNPTGVSLGELLGAQADEVLAVSLASDVCRKPVVEEFFVVRYRGRLFAWFRALGASAHDADDLTQEVLLKAVRCKLDAFDSEKNARFAGFLHYVARNTFLDSRRRKQTRSDLVGEGLEQGSRTIDG